MFSCFLSYDSFNSLFLIVLVSIFNLGVASASRLIAPYAHSASWNLLAQRELCRTTALSVSIKRQSAGLPTSTLLTDLHFILIQITSNNWEYMWAHAIYSILQYSQKHGSNGSSGWVILDKFTCWQGQEQASKNANKSSQSQPKPQKQSNVQKTVSNQIHQNTQG